MFNKNKIIASFTCLITVLVAVFIFICPINNSDIALMTKRDNNPSGCETVVVHSVASRINDFVKKCFDFHVANANFFLNTRVITVNVFSSLFLIAIFAFLFSIKLAIGGSFFTLSQLRQRYLLYLNKLKLLQEKKFKKWSTLFNYHEIVSIA